MLSGPHGGSPADNIAADAAAGFSGSFPSPPRLSSSAASEWSPADVGAWVSEVLKLPQYAEAFEVQQVDGPTLLELPEDLLDSELGIKNPIHRKKIVAHVKLLGASIETLTQSRLQRPPCGQRGQTARSSRPNWASGPEAAVRNTLDISGCGSDEDVLSSAGAASWQRGEIASGASSNGGTGGLLGCYSGASSNLAYGRHQDLSVVSSNFSGHGTALASRAAARRGRSMDRLAYLQQTGQVTPRCGPLSRQRSGDSQATSPTGTVGSLRSVGVFSQQSLVSQTRRRQGSRGPQDGKAMAASGKRIDAWGELGPSTSRKGSFGKLDRQASREYSGAHPCTPLSPRRDCDPVTSYYYKATLQRSPQSAVIGSARRRLSELGPSKSVSPGPVYRPQVEWTKLRVGGAIGGAKRFGYDRPNCNAWLNEVRDD